jgi:hypothetical protein
MKVVPEGITGEEQEFTDNPYTQTRSQRTRALRAKDSAIRKCRANKKPKFEEPHFIRIVDIIFSPDCIDEGQAVFDAMEAEDERTNQILLINNKQNL